MDRSVRSSAAKAQDSPALETGARLGYAASGVLHLLLAWVAIQLVVGHAATADQTGALGSLATTGPGKALLWVVLTGFMLLAVWHVTEVVARRGRGRVKPAAKAEVYLALAWTTFRVIQGTAANGNQQSVHTTGALMSHPGGRLLVAAIGVVIVAVAVHHVLKGGALASSPTCVHTPGRRSSSRVGSATSRRASRCSSSESCSSRRPRRRTSPRRRDWTVRCALC